MSHKQLESTSQASDQSLPKLPLGYCRTLANLSSLRQDKYLRSVAEFRNLQERTKRDIAAARDFAIQRFAADLIESIDNLDRALGSVPPEVLSPDFSPPDAATSNTSSEDPNAAALGESVSEADAPNKDLLNLHAGLKMTESILMSTLKKHGLERFDPQDEGRKFDPRLDEATFMTKVEGREDGDVFHTQSKGFILNGRVIRPAKVGVVKNS
jgi:molecular chaperone GrpE